MNTAKMTDNIGLEPQQARTSDVEILENVKFSEIGLSGQLVQGLKKAGYTSPSPIQLRALPLACSGLDILVQAKSGTGKTLVFACVILEKYRPTTKSPQSLVVVPTREIAVQIVSVLNAVGKDFKHFRADSFIGGLEIADDRKKIAKTRCIVATPGRCLHLLQNKVINTSDINLLVLDEADNLITNDSMKSDILKIYDYLGEKKQVLAVSATFENGCDKVLCKLMKNPVGVTPRKEIPVLKGVKQFVRTISNQADNIKEMFSKVEQLKKILSSVQFKQCLVFVNSQMRADSYNVYLNRAGHPCEVICGSQDQKKRLQVLERLKAFKCRVLLATDLMARGIDVENVNLIVNLEIPYDSSTYLHRIGRAGRYGSHGIAITVLQENELEKFQRMLGEIGGEGMSVLKFPDNMSKAPDVEQPVLSTAAIKCFDFLVNLIKLSKTEPKSIQDMTILLCQDLVDGKIEAEKFVERFAALLGTAPQPRITVLLKESLSALRESLATGELIIVGINPPPLESSNFGKSYSQHLWDFDDPNGDKRRYGEIFGLVGSPSQSKSKKEAETIAKNMELLEISKRLVNPSKSADESYFHGESLYEDYENFKEKFRLSAEAKEFPAPNVTKSTEVAKEPEPMIKKIELGGLLNVISSFMSDLQAKESDSAKLETVQNTDAVRNLNVADLYDDYSKMKRAAESTEIQENEKTVDAEISNGFDNQEAIINRSTDSALELEFFIEKKVEGDDLNMEDIFLEYAQMKSMQNEQRNAADSGNSDKDSEKFIAEKVSVQTAQTLNEIPKSVPATVDISNIYDDYDQMKKSQPASEETAQDPSADYKPPSSPAKLISRPTAQKLGAIPKQPKVNYNDIATIFDDYDQMKKTQLAQLSAGIPVNPKRLQTNDSRNDSIFLQALAYSNKSASNQKLVTTNSTNSIVSNIGSDCASRLDEIDSYIPDADLLPDESDSGSGSSCSSTEASETSDSGEESDYFDDDSEQMPVNPYESTNKTVNETYQQSYAMWSNMFWNQTTKILDYVKYTNYINENNAELME